MLGGVFVVQPNSAKVLSLCGRYVGTVKAPGMHFTNPLYAKQTVSLKVGGRGVCHTLLLLLSFPLWV